MKIQTLIAMLTFAASGAVMAQAPTSPTATPRIDKREARQQKRIDQGIASGNLTQTEATRLEAREVRMKEAEAKAKSDGVVTAKERAALTHKENRNSRRIYKQKHDAQKVG